MKACRANGLATDRVDDVCSSVQWLSLSVQEQPSAEKAPRVNPNTNVSIRKQLVLAQHQHCFLSQTWGPGNVRSDDTCTPPWQHAQLTGF